MAGIRYFLVLRLLVAVEVEMELRARMVLPGALVAALEQQDHLGLVAPVTLRL
jgi:hypothetical protein